MKLHLPIALLTALVLCNAAYANGVYTVKETVSVESGSSVSLSNEENGAAILNKLGTAAADYQKGDPNPAAVVKQGAGELVIDKDVNMNNPFVIDEGSVVIKDATVSSYRSYSNATSGLSIGGASLTLDNGHYTQTGNDVYAMCIGNRDGAASLVLENGSTMQNTHYIFAGYTHSSAEDYRVGVDATPAAAYATSTIKVLSGSKLTAGTSFQFANVDVLVEGTGSVMADNGVNKDGGNVWPDSYFGAGYERDVDINVTKGGALDLNWNAYTGMGHSSNVLINITGVDAETGTASSLDVAGILYLSSTGDYRDSSASAGSNYDTLTTLNITEGAKANVNQLVMGMDAGKADVTVGSGSTYTGKSMLVGANGSFTNNGTTTLTGGKVTEWYTNDVDVYGKQTVTKEGDLKIAGGKVSNNGTMEVQKLNMTSGTVLNDKPGEATATTANGTLENNGKLTVQKASSIVDSSVTNTSGTLEFKDKLTVENSSIKATDGTIRVRKDTSLNRATISTEKGDIFIGSSDKPVSTEIANSTFTTSSTTSSGSINFYGDVALNGGNTFTGSNGSQQICFTKGAVTANGNNNFAGGINANEFYAQSGVQTFKSIAGASTTMGFGNIGFAEGADSSAQIHIDATQGSGYVNIMRSSSVTSLKVADSYELSLFDVVTVTDTVDISSTINFRNTTSMLALEIDDLAELMGGDTMLTLAESAKIKGTANIQLLFTENALNQMTEGQILDLSNVTNAADLTISLGIAADTDLSVEDIFGATSFTTGADGSVGSTLTVQTTIPEPTTATLSLLALASLAMRRRRK